MLNVDALPIKKQQINSNLTRKEENNAGTNDISKRPLGGLPNHGLYFWGFNPFFLDKNSNSKLFLV